VADKKISAEEIKNAANYKALLEKQLELENQLVIAEQKRRDLSGKRVSHSQKEVELLQSQIELAERNLEVINDGHRGIEETINSLEKQSGKEKEINRLKELQKKLQGENIHLYQQENEALIAISEALIANKVAGISINQELMAMVGVTDQWREGITGAFIGAAEHGGSFSEILKTIGEELKTDENILNIFGSTLEKSQEVLSAVVASTLSMATTIDKVQSSVMLSTGEFGRYDSMINEVRVSQLHMAATAEQVGEAITGLFHTVRAFSLLSKSAQKDLVSFTTTMELMGVSGEATAGSLQVSMAVLGQTKEQAIVTQKELLGVAKALKEAPETLVKGFADSASALAKHGDKMLGVFSRLSAAAKALQTDVSVLTGAFGTQMDTFEGAAMSAAKINQLLGAQFIDPMKLMHADEEQRVRMVLEGIEKSGQRASLLENKFGRLAFASAAGISDVADANKLLQMGLGGYDQMIAKSNATAISQKEMEEKATKATDVMKKLASVMQSLAISMEPVVDAVKWLAGGIVKMQQAWAGTTPTIAILVGLMSTAVLTLKAMALARAAGIPLMTTELSISQGMALAKKAEATSRNQNASAMQREATASKNQAASGAAGAGTATMMMAKAKAAMAYGAALLFVGVGFLAVAAGVSMLANAMKGLSGDEFLMTAGLVTAIGVGMYFLGTAVLAAGIQAGVAAAPLLAAGAAITLIGLGLALPITAIALLINQLKSFAPVAIEASSGFLIMSAGLGILAASAVAIAGAGPAAFVGLGLMAAGLGLVALAVNLMSDELGSLGKMFEGIGKFAEAGQVNFTGMVKGVKDLAVAAEGITAEKLTGFSALATVTHRIAESAKVFDQPEVKTGVTRIKETIRTGPAAATLTGGGSSVTLSAESAKILAGEIVNSMKAASSDWKFFLKLGDGSSSDYMRMHNAAAQKARGK
jgi:hypothetical protein